MIRSVHNKFNTRSNLTKLADNQLIAIPIIKVSNVAFKIRISDIGKVTDNNVRIFDCRKREKSVVCDLYQGINMQATSYNHEQL